MSRRSLLILIFLLAIAAIASTGVLDSGGDHSPEPSHSTAEPGAPTPTSAPEDETRLAPRLALGQMIVARFSGDVPPPQFFDRIERGEVGGVILFEENLDAGEVAIEQLTQRLQDAAQRGDNPPLLIMVDQEGGTVKRLPGPPRVAAKGMADEDDAREQGEATGNLLGRLGINVDLAPVVDVDHPGSFLRSRAFASSADEVEGRACEFAAGLRAEGVAATLKHFPGLGLAAANTDESVVTIDASAAEVRADYAPYRSCGSEPLTLVMVNSVVYPALTGALPAVMAPLTYERELPEAGVAAVTISDDLESPAIKAQTTPARHSINAGLDLLLYAKSETVSAEAHARLLDDMRNGLIKQRRVYDAAAKILTLKEQLADP